MEEHEMIEHFFHRHPLRRLPNRDAVTGDYRWYSTCNGCRRFFLPGEAAYGCCDDNCRFPYCLHEECLEMPREIRHHLHPSHTLTKQDLDEVEVGKDSRCAVCEEPKYGCGFGYICSEGCKLWIHLECVGGQCLGLDDEHVMKHPSHPQHELRFLKRKPELCSFQCNACGTMEKGSSYICSICQYWIHESCAALPVTADFPHHHNHSLSLAFHPPHQYIKYQDECGICRGALRMRHWVYHCQLCRYVVHIKCATNTSPAAASTKINDENAADDGEDIMKAPIDDNKYEEIICRGLVKREILDKYNHHHHPLSFISFSESSSCHDRNEEDSDDDDDLENIALIRCECCTMPIHQKSNGYMSCGECKYFLHLSCFNLPPHLPSHPLHSIEDHNLLLQKSDHLIKYRDWPECSVCGVYTNGHIYACTKCRFKIDIKCASLPDTIKHAGHHHYLKLVVDKHNSTFCGACFDSIYSGKASYKCDSCNFSICFSCVLLPPMNKHESEKHRLPLTYDAYVNHPDEFYCGSCEQKMNPKTWMYHCRDCDQSFHPRCFPTTSGWFRNVNFLSWQQYYVNVSTTYHQPHHPLTFQLITKKKQCDLCHHRGYGFWVWVSELFGWFGFQCASCNFAMCYDNCREKAIKG